MQGLFNTPTPPRDPLTADHDIGLSPGGEGFFEDESFKIDLEKGDPFFTKKTPYLPFKRARFMRKNNKDVKPRNAVSVRDWPRASACSCSFACVCRPIVGSLWKHHNTQR